jgi:predicted ATPase/DNA-binding SARP family transcriptional activator
MPHLALSFFGAFQATLNDERLTGFHSVKVQALLAYLVLEQRPHHRASLATLLWPLDAEASARNSLRQALYELRKLFGDRDDLDTPFLLVTRQSVQFNLNVDYILDVADFLRYIQQGQLEQAVSLYQGDLLAGLSCESEPFEEWLRLTRARLHNQAVDACFKLTDQALQQGDLVRARTYAERQLALELWREEAHRQLMSALALSGERSTALAQYETCRRALAEELGVEPDAETTALYEQIRAGKWRGQAAILHLLPASPRVRDEPLVGSTPPRHNLPPQLTPFIGRQTDLAQIAARLNDPACRLLTIVGPGGMGKTRLAIQAAQTILVAKPTTQIDPKSDIPHAKFADGVFFVALVGVATHDLLVPTIATALDFTFYGSGDPKAQLLDYLKARSLLLVMDNCEHLLAGIELVSDLLAAAPGVKVLATSREPLSLREEWLHPLTGMSFPTAEMHTAPLDSYTAVQFFVQCARQMKPGFDLAAEAAAVVRICRLVDGMPLGIELASTWLKLFPCAQIAREVEQSLDFLATTLRNVPGRHRNMRAVFEHSWGLLTTSEQVALRRLSIFQGGFNRAAARQVAGATFPLVVALAEKSLIQVAENERYQMHELLRQFAEEKLRTDPAEMNRIQGDHSRYYTTFLAQQETRLKGPAHLAAMQEIEEEIENVRTAWSWAVAHDKLDALEHALDSFAYFLETRLWQDQAIVLFEHALTTLAARLPEDRRQLLLARILACQGGAYGQLSGEGGRPEVAGMVERLEQCLTMLQRLGETKATANILEALGSLVEDPRRGQELRRSALAIYEKHGDPWNLARLFEALGFTANILGDFEEAKHYYQRGVALCEELGDRRVLGDIQAIFSELYRVLGEYAEAARLAHASLIERTAVGNKRGVAYSLYVLGALAWRMGNYEEARQYSLQSRDTFAEIGLLGGIDFALSNLGTIACTLGDYAEARRQFHKILESNLGRDVLHYQTVPWGLVGMAEVLYQEEQPEEAIELIEQVLRHPKAWQEAKDRATNLLAELQAILPPEVVAAAQERSRTGDLRTTVARLIGTTPA